MRNCHKIIKLIIFITLLNLAFCDGIDVVTKDWKQSELDQYQEKRSA